MSYITNKKGTKTHYICKRCGKTKPLNRTARWFCGSLYTTRQEDFEQDFLKRVCSNPIIKYAEWSVEEGEGGCVHYQFRLEFTKSDRRTKVSKYTKVDKIGQLWVEPICCAIAQEHYVKKDRTHIAGPWEYVTGRPAGRQFKPEQVEVPTLIPGQNDKEVMNALLKNMWTDIKYGHCSQILSQI